MRKLCKYLSAFACIFLINACSSDHVVFKEDEMINTEAMINTDGLIEQGQKRADRSVKYGPKIQEDTNMEIRNSFREQIYEQKAPDYVDLSNAEAWNIFPIDINIENMEMQLFADLMSEVTGVNILVSDEVQGTVTAKMKGVAWSNVLDTVLQMKTLAKHVDSKANIIRIHDQNTVVKLEDFKRKRRENLHRSRQLEKAAEPRYTEVFKLFYTKPDSMKETLRGVFGISGDKKEEAYMDSNPEITIDERLNLLIVKARKEDINIISKLIEKLDSRTKQVFIEAFIVEVSDGFQDEFGTRIGLDGSDVGRIGDKSVNGRVTGVATGGFADVVAGEAGAALTNLGATTPFGGIGLLAGLGSAADLKLELSAMESDGLSRVISNPRIFTLDNQEAIIFQGDEVPFETVSDEGTKVEFKEAGLRLAVLPQVIGDGHLLMNIQVNKDTVDTTIDNPPISKSEIKTSLVSKDGAIVVIGGIYGENKTKATNKVPGFGDLPGIGKLFKRESQQDDRSELMIFIAPRVI